jgi:hypothetical protein
MSKIDVWDVLDAQDRLAKLHTTVLQTLAACLGTVIISALMLMARTPLALAVVYAGLMFLAWAIAFVQAALCHAEECRVRAFVAQAQGGA